MNNENLKKWALIGEIVGAFAVVLTLVFVALQIRQSSQETALNTKAVEAEVIWARAAQSAEMALTIAQDANFAEIASRLSELPEDQLRSSDSADIQRFAYWWVAWRSYWEARFLTMTSDSEREALRATIRNRLSSPGVRYMISRSNNDGSNPEFREFVAELLQEFE